MKHKLFILSSLAFGIFLLGLLPAKAQLSLIPYENSIYQISTPEHLKYLSTAVQNDEITKDKSFQLMNDIDMSGVDDYIPIGGWDNYNTSNKTKYFSGNFNGNDHKISNLVVNRDIGGPYGVFGNINNALIENLIVKKCNFEANGYIGGLAGFVDSSIIRNCHTEVYCKNLSWGDVLGGFAGDVRCSNIANCSSIDTVIASTYRYCSTGGFIGLAWNTHISKSFSKGVIIDTASTDGQYKYTGGFIGHLGIYATFRTNIQNCYSRTGIYSNSKFVGGFLGGQSNLNEICMNCYAAPSKFEITMPLYCGLFHGICSNKTINCYFSTANFDFNGMGYCSPPYLSLFGKSDVELCSPDMISFSGSLGTSLNFGLEAPVWAQDVTNINDGFPILSWQNPTQVKENTIPDIKVYPNPSTGELRIENGELKINSVEIFDIYGRKCHVSRVTRHENSIDISHLHSGIYFVKITTDAGIVVKKIIKQ